MIVSLMSFRHERFLFITHYKEEQMSANQEAKKVVIDEIKQNISNAKSIVLVTGLE